MNAVLKALGRTGVALLAVATLVLSIFGSLLVYDFLSRAAYTFTELIAFVAFIGGIVSLLAAIARRPRVGVATVLTVATWGIVPFLWVWSVIIVGSLWGADWLMIFSAFLPIGMIVGALVVALLSAHWWILVQLTTTIAVIAVFRIIALSLMRSTKGSSPVLSVDYLIEREFHEARLAPDYGAAKGFREDTRR